MLNVGQNVEDVSDLISSQAAVEEILPGNLAEIIKNAGLDPAILENLPMEQLSDLMTSAGFDPSKLSDGEFQEVINQLTNQSME